MSEEKILREFEIIANKNDGILRAEDVIKFASNPKTALHEKFIWDDTDAAHQWRLHQARNLIRVMVNITPSDGKEYRVYVSLTPDREEPGGGYRSLDSVMSDDKKREQLLADALSEMEVFKSKYSRLKELVKIFDEMEKVIVQKKRVKARSTGLSATA